MPRPTRDKGATRQALVEAARLAFAERGFEGARNQAIADAAGTNKAMINYIFGGKKGLFSAVILQDIIVIREALAAVEASTASPGQRLGELVAALAGALAANPCFPLIMAREQMSGAHRLDPEVRDAFFGFFRVTRSILESGIRDGEFRQADPHAVHLCLVGSLIYFLMTAPARETYAAQGAMPSPDPGWDDHVAEIGELLRRGLTPPFRNSSMRPTHPGTVQKETRKTKRRTR